MEPETTVVARVLRTVRDQPGTCTQTVARTLSVDHSTAAYHLRRLERRGRVSSVVTGRERRHYPKGHPSCPFLRIAESTLDHAATTRVLRAVHATAASRAVDVARATGVAIAQVRWVLIRLEQMGFIVKVAPGRFTVPEDVHPCLPHAFERTACREWGRCAVSQSTWVDGLLGRNERLK